MNTIPDCRYKVKLTPGTSKRGKAAKTAVQVFLRDKNATPREKDLLKAVKVTHSILLLSNMTFTLHKFLQYKTFMNTKTIEEFNNIIIIATIDVITIINRTDKML